VRGVAGEASNPKRVTTMGKSGLCGTQNNEIKKVLAE